MNKDTLIKNIFNFVNFADSVKSKIEKPIITSFLVGLVVGGYSLMHDSALWAAFIPALVPFLVLCIYWWVLDGVTSARDDILEIGEYIQDVKGLKDVKLKSNRKGRVSFRKNLSNVAQVGWLLANASILKGAPSTVIGSIRTIRGAVIAFNPLFAVITLVSFISLWVFSITVPFTLFL